MSSWHEAQRESRARDFILIACAVPVLFFVLDFLLTKLAGVFA